MKKVLFVLGLALCSTFAMAQTNNLSGKICKPTPGNEKRIFEAPQQQVDYKASIFTKDGEDVVLAHYTFANASQVTIGVVGANDVIDDTVVGAIKCNNRSEPCFRWARIPDTNYVMDSVFAEDYANFINYTGQSVNNLLLGMGAYNDLTDNNGFMMLSLIEMSANNNYINTYFQLANPVALNGAQVVDVTWRQLYRKYYDVCYLDYMLNGSWHSFEVNVTGVDVDVNTYGPLHYSTTLPTAALNQATLSLRIRVTDDGSRSVYGYGWAIDDVKVIAPAATTRWSFNSPGNINGFYGTLPQGMTVPMSYAVFSRNIGADNLTGINLGVQHRTGSTGDWATAFTAAQNQNMPAGDPTTNYVLEINEAGFMYAGYGCGDYVGYHSFPEYFADHYRVSDEALANEGFLRRGLPSTTAGMNQFLITADNAQGLSDTLAAYTYTVSESLDVDSSFGRTVPGYRWGNDNGIVPGGSEFAYGFSSNTAPVGEPSNAGYVTDECGHQYAQDYEVLTRYNTPSAIPTDDNGNPWVIRGIEFVTSTKVTEAEAAGARFIAEMYRYELREGVDTGWYGYMGYAGLSGNEVYLVGEGNVAPTEEDLLDYATAENGNYYAVNVFFPEQPAIEPNTSFLLGYTLRGGGNFAVASQATRYKSQMGDFSDANYTSYRNNEETAPYYNQFSPANKPYDVYCYDPIQGSRGGSGSHVVTGWNIDEYPLIRLIVGPKMQLDTNYVYANCSEDENERYDYWVYSNTNRKGICGSADTTVVGAVYSYLVFPGDPSEEEEEHIEMNDAQTEYYYVADHDDDFLPSKVIDAIYINGNPIDLTDSNMVTVEDYSVYWAGHTPLATSEADRWEPALTRNAYRITLRNITDDMTITASVHDENLKIRNAEDKVNIILAPNPATSQVRLTVGSFAGKANCSIIDMSGRVVYNADITSGESVINLNGVPAGAYFVRVTNDSFSKVEKLIVR